MTMLTINPATKVITIPQSYTTLVSGTLYSLDTNQLRLDVLALLDDEDYIWMDDAFIHNTEVSVAGTTYARTISTINGWSYEFSPDSQWSVRLEGSNNDFFDIEAGILNQNQVQVIPTNSAGLISTGTGLTSIQSQYLQEVHEAHYNDRILDRNADTITIFAADGITPIHVFATNSDLSEIRKQ